MPPTTSNADEHAEKMDRIYKLQRHFYDLTRKFYLLGRDRLIEMMALKPGMNVLEIGCGTARNLIALAKKHPQIQFYGLDASREMLETAQKKSTPRNSRAVSRCAIASPNNWTPKTPSISTSPSTSCSSPIRCR